MLASFSFKLVEELLLELMLLAMVAKLTFESDFELGGVFVFAFESAFA